ncbi:hypothetical protein RUND412_006014 [Rhizina undulata]
MTTENSTEESTWPLPKDPDGLQLYTKKWKTPAAPVAQILFLHGFSDHCNAYYTLPSYLASRGIEFFSFDQRGWGRSAPNKSQWGLSGGTSQLLSDIDGILEDRLNAHAKIPCFLVGHSMGGGVALTYALRGKHRDRLAGTVVWSPMIELAPDNRPLGLVVEAGKWAAKVLPNKQLVQKLNPSWMSRDEEVNKAFTEDKLCHDTGTLIGISDMLTRGKDLTKPEIVKAFKKNMPILILHGTGDKITDHTASKRLIEMLDINDKELKSYDGWYHKLHAEPGEDRTKFACDVAEWILARVAPAPKL